MVAAPSLPDRPTKPLDRAQRLVASIDARSVRLPWLAIATDRNDRVGTPCCNRCTTRPGVLGTVTTDDGDAPQHSGRMKVNNELVFGNINADKEVGV